MADTRFFRKEGPFTLAELASRIEAEVANDADASRQVSDVAPLDAAGNGELSFCIRDDKGERLHHRS